MQKTQLGREEAHYFVQKVLSDATAAGISPQDLLIDHLCYRTSSMVEYTEIVTKMKRGAVGNLQAELLTESPVNGRPIATFRFHQALQVGDLLVEALEIPAPKAGTHYHTGFEHIEAVIREDFSSFASRHPKLNIRLPTTTDSLNPEAVLSFPNGNLKLHHLPLSCIIAIEEKTDLHRSLLQTKLLARLAPWSPMLSGSLPLGIELPSSDLDILLHALDLDACQAGLQRELGSLGIHATFNRTISAHGPSLIACFQLNSFPIEIFATGIPVFQQNGHRHLLNEYRLLVRHGQSLKTQVLGLKRQGLSTEEAFAKALGLAGDPYQAMLDVS